MSIPKTLGGCADKLYQLNEKKREASKKVTAIEEEIKALKEHVIESLPKSKLTGASGKLANVRVVTKAVPQVKDYDKFYNYVKENEAFDLLQRRLSEAAIKARFEEGEKIPGIDFFNVVSVSITKAK